MPQQEEKGLGAAIVIAKKRGAKANVCIVDVSKQLQVVSLAGQQREGKGVLMQASQDDVCVWRWAEGQTE